MVSSDPWLPSDKIELYVKNLPVAKLNDALDKVIDKTTNPVLHQLAMTWGPICHVDGHNTVQARTERNQLPHKTRVPPWTIAVESVRFAKFLSEIKEPASRKICNKVSSFLKSVAFGDRMCAFNLWSPRTICEVLNKYSHVVWVGDSLTRHTTMALLSLVVSDLQFGAVPKGYAGNEKFPFDMCQCDGVYSEKEDCREYNESSFAAAISDKCQLLLNGRFTTEFKYDSVYRPEWPLHSTSNCKDPRPIFLYYQGGRSGNLPHEILAEDKRHVRRHVTSIYNFSQRCGFSVRELIANEISTGDSKPDVSTSTSGLVKPVSMVFAGANVQNRKYDSVYHTQRREQHLMNNDAWKKYIANHYPGMLFLDFYNITLQPPAESSDGYHYLSATNIEKANSIIQLMKLMLT